YLELELLAGIRQRFVEAERKIVVRRERLALCVALVPRDEAVGERPADVHGYTLHVATSMTSAITPLRFERIDIQLDIVQRRVTWGQIFHLHQCAALRAVVFEDPAPLRIGRIGAGITGRIQQRLVDLARIAVVNEQPTLVIVARVDQHPLAAAAFPLLGLEIDAQILGDLYLHFGLTCAARRRRTSPAELRSKVQPSSTRAVKYGSSSTTGPLPRTFPGRLSSDNSGSSLRPAPNATLRLLEYSMAPTLRAVNSPLRRALGTAFTARTLTRPCATVTLTSHSDSCMPSANIAWRARSSNSSRA